MGEVYAHYISVLKSFIEVPLKNIRGMVYAPALVLNTRRSNMRLLFLI